MSPFYRLSQEWWVMPRILALANVRIGRCSLPKPWVPIYLPPHPKFMVACHCLLYWLWSEASGSLGCPTPACPHPEALCFSPPFPRCPVFVYGEPQPAPVQSFSPPQSPTSNSNCPTASVLMATGVVPPFKTLQSWAVRCSSHWLFMASDHLNMAISKWDVPFV